MAKKRDTYKYQFKVGRKVIYRGITNDIRRREAEHKQRWPSGKIHQIGAKTTRRKALEWERDGGKSTRS